MPANEFEKQVQKQMEGFRLEPSASVWENVEKEIREKKRRRIIFFFLLPLAAGLIGFSLYQLLYPGKKETSASQTVSAEEKLPSNDQNNRAPGNGVKQPSVSKTSSDNKIDYPLQPQTETVKKTIAGETAIDMVSRNKRTATIPVSRPAQNKITRPVLIKRTQDNSMAVTVDAPSTQKTVKDDNTAAETAVSDALKVVTTSITALQKDTVAKGSETVNAEAAIVKQDSVMADDAITESDNKETKPLQKVSSSKWKWGIEAAGGLAYNNKSTLTFARAEAFDNLSYAAPGTGIGNGPVAIIPPSPVREGAAFRFGIIAEKQVSKRSRIAAGLQYAYASNRISVGTAVDTTIVLQSNATSSLADLRVEKLYSGAQKNDYTNRYHFIRVPFMYHWQINKGKLPVELNAGAGISYLVRTNALVYSRSLGGIYYEDKHAFNKLHWDLSTGLSFRLKAKNNQEWVIGPQLSFDMTRLVKEDNKQYLMYGGIQARWLFPSKKK
ncbi:MAG: hypothetical protein JNK14_19325 [Chitinophagaceae bacterium]|nr:hypothetical protein [Chitinophagaceae bacterium]